MTDPVAFWHAEHVNFSKLLDLFERELAAFHEGGQPDYGLMLGIVQYLRYFPDRHHHPREDVAFACLAKYDPSLKTRLNRLKQEHRVLEAAGEELLQQINGIVQGVLMARAAVEAAAATYLVYYRHHLASEEKLVLPRAAELLTPQDWSAVGAATPAARDPLFGEASGARYRELRRQIALQSQPAAGV